MNKVAYKRFRDAVNEAFLELDAPGRRLCVVIPTVDGAWRIAHNISKSALKSPSQIDWVAMWEQIAHLAQESRRQFLWTRLMQLRREGHPLASRAMHALELEGSAFLECNIGIGGGVSQGLGGNIGGIHGESFDDDGPEDNFSGVEDEVNDAMGDNEGWQDGFDR